MALQIILTAAGVAIPFPASMILPLLSMRNSNYVDGVLGQFGYLKASETNGMQFDFRWAIDPSGYVYDSETDERLSGVKTTAYWIEPDGTDTFFDTVPSSKEYGTVWNATEWDQVNPLYTDAQGKYAWDVPEGWWRVKYEKAGYETTWSDWLPVPPPQTDVNIGMKKLATYPHEFTDVPYEEATCTKEGHVAHKTCSHCDLLFDVDGNVIETVVIAIADHIYDDDSDLDCNKCGAVREIAPGCVLGDVNDDGKINNKDLGLIQRYINGWGVKINSTAADFNQDGNIDKTDFDLIQSYINK